MSPNKLRHLALLQSPVNRMLRNLGSKIERVYFARGQAQNRDSRDSQMASESDVSINLTPLVVTLPPPGAGIATKFNASGVLWWNAAFFADQCGQLEEKYRSSFFNPKGEWTPIQRVER